MPARGLHGSSVVDDGRAETGTVAEDIVFLYGQAVAQAESVVPGAVVRTGLKPGPRHFFGDVKVSCVFFFLNKY